jgi:superoxide reductase
MASRRDFLKGSLVVAGAAIAARATVARAAESCPAGLLYTKSAPGRWAGKEGAHAPRVTVEGGKVTIVTPHPMSAAHFIVKHTLLDDAGKVLGEKTFTNADAASAESTHQLPAGFTGGICAASFCNLHDLWVTQATV